ncbi:type IV pilus twitching motility protein PilT [Youxingia wuxianensis]|uniref:PilT/PilU family type 4a pilus ATPase n=1 Tax=Youxingia wuxianensis TaxID=2763678 RepID=A0A926EQX2_9FIRM|nr:PilT/PilU family type 4a pilus ATPase [Youxingia wuxianensis]MBC8584724.1 PilT/PilU family type 4a pilus ATPase [Youxingia wuxianensis]
METIAVLKEAVDKQVSDIFIIPGLPLSYKTQGYISSQGEEMLKPVDTEKIINDIYTFAGNRDIGKLISCGDDDFSFSLKGISRFRVNTYKQRGTLAAVIRVVSFALPDPQTLGIPQIVLDLAQKKKGLVLVTGPAGSGKSTTLACMIDLINNTRNSHVITLEDPIEYLHSHKKSIVSQREISTDTESYVTALRAALRQSPDVILLGELRDHNTISTAMTAAETGHLVLSTLHTVGAANTIDRVIDAFPPNQQSQIRVQLSMVLQAVVSQQLIPGTRQEEVAAFEIMQVNGAIRNMIRENKVHQIDTVIYSSADSGMISMDTSLLNLVKNGLISDKDALVYSANPDMLKKKLAGIS